MEEYNIIKSSLQEAGQFIKKKIFIQYLQMEE